MPLFSFEGLTPRIHASAFVAPTATLVGDVIVEEGASIWYGAVIRADYAPVIVRRRRERAGQRGDPRPARAHHRRRRRARPSATTAWCTARSLEEECLVANGSVVLDGATIGAGALVAAGSVVAAGAIDPGRACSPRARPRS